MSEELKQALAGLDAIDKRIGEMQDAMKRREASQEEVTKKVAELGEVQLKLSRQLLELQQKSQKAEGDRVHASLGSYVTKSESYKTFLTSRRPVSVVYDTKADGDPILSSAGQLRPYRVPGIQALEQRELVIEDLFPHIPISENSVEYVKEKSFTNNAAPVAEAAQKPASTLETETAQTPVQVVAHWTRITRQLADDAGALAAFINARMVYGVDLAVENQILSGNGTSPSLSGLMKTGNYTAQEFTLAQIGGSTANLLDLLRMSFAKVNYWSYRTSAVLLNPMDWASLQGLKGSNGEYLLGSPADSFANSTVWGVRVVQTAAMDEGKFLAGDFARAATVYDRMQTVIDIASQNEDDFIKNLYTIRAERRLALAVERTKAMIGGTFALPAAPVVPGG